MTRFRSWASLLGVLLVCAPAAAAATKSDRYAGADEVATKIDRLLEASWKKSNLTPARPADDAEWLRRIYLDLGRPNSSVTEREPSSPTASRRNGNGSSKPFWRERAIRPRSASVWAYPLLLPEVSSSPQVRILAPTFERWLRNWLASDQGYDWMVSQLATSNSDLRGMRSAGSPNPASVFYFAKENKAEELAATFSSAFLGVNLQCAQCHNHPFASWKRDQFWSFAAFFSDVPQPGRGRERTSPQRRLAVGELVIPGTDKVVKAKYLDGKQPAPAEDGAPALRNQLARWMTSADNPYFARAAVNRMWAHFFGTGFIEPLDSMAGTEVVPIHPEVIEELAQAFSKSQYDPRWLIRTITSTKAYQLSSAGPGKSADATRLFARMALRGLNGEQLYDSLTQATGFRDDGPGVARGRGGFGGTRNEFLAKFASSGERSTEAQTSILQALTLMNGSVMASATNLSRSETLMAVADSPFLDMPAKIETLYLATLSRKPTSKEKTRLLNYLEKAADESESSRRATKLRHEALADVFWALLNSAEFVVNH